MTAYGGGGGSLGRRRNHLSQTEPADLRQLILDTAAMPEPNTTLSGGAVDLVISGGSVAAMACPSQPSGGISKFDPIVCCRGLRLSPRSLHSRAMRNRCRGRNLLRTALDTVQPRARKRCHQGHSPAIGGGGYGGLGAANFIQFLGGSYGSIVSPQPRQRRRLRRQQRVTRRRWRRFVAPDPAGQTDAQTAGSQPTE